MMSEFYLEKPLDFDSDLLEVSTVFMEHDNKVLLLHRVQCALSPETWGVPGGKLEKGETPVEGLIREIEEELQLHAQQKELTFVRSVYVRHPKVQYLLHLFRWTMDVAPTIVLNPKEHSSYLWQQISDFHQVPLLEGQLEAFHFVYGK